jgi:hypothetical protein
LLALMRLDGNVGLAQYPVNHWDQRDTVVITYGDSLLRAGEKPLRTLKTFLDEHSDGLLSGVHILPFYPWSSDDGFSVLDYSSVNESLGDWSDIKSIASDYDLMADLVINHCSSRSLWFDNFQQGRSPGKDYFFTASPEDDLSDVVRPRTSPLLREVQTPEGTKYVWCTFSHDQVDLDFRNLPNRENLSYFGNANEAHCVYNFSLPPLLVNTLITGDCAYLKQWMMSMPPAQNGTAYFNFIASHDGIGLRPAEGLLSDGELDTLIATMQRFGGHVSYRALDDGRSKPYEINIALFDALQGTTSGPDSWGLERFVCAHAIMLGLEGIPGIYIHSLLGTRNDYDRVENTGHYRAINRHQWDSDLLALSAINLIDTEDWLDLISGEQLQDREQQLELQPYQTVWITNAPGRP